MSDDIHQEVGTSPKLLELLSRHRALDDAIQALENRAYRDQLQIQRLKKEKLLLKERIERVRTDLIPDLDA